MHTVKPTIRHPIIVAAITLLSSLPAAPAGAAIIDLRAPHVEAIDEAPRLHITTAGRTVTVETLDGVLNRTASGFGVNAPGSDDSDAIDGASIREEVRLYFDAAVRLLGLVLSGLGGDDRADVSYGPHHQHVQHSGLHDLNAYLLDGAEVLSVAHGAGNGFSLDAVHFEAVSLAPPEPPSDAGGEQPTGPGDEAGSGSPTDAPGDGATGPASGASVAVSAPASAALLLPGLLLLTGRAARAAGKHGAQG